MRKSNRKTIKAKLDKVWREHIYQRDKTCQKCGKLLTKGHRNAHHIVTKGASGLAGRWDVQNGIGLCIYCHRHESGKYYVEFRDFIVNWCGKQGFDYYELRDKYKGNLYKPTLEDLSIKLELLKGGYNENSIL